jgi:phosphoadenosine phosphosulfate reductase
MRPVALGERLTIARSVLEGRIRFTTSFGLEDQVITHAIFTAGLDIEVVTLDTGRLFPETYELWAQTEEKYERRIKAFAPNGELVEKLVEDQGIDGFRHSVEARKACCGVRKVEPLSRALAGTVAWVTGLRAEQSENRQETSFAAYEPSYGLVKLNPLADWSTRDVARYIADKAVPYNPLHDRGFPSIGCAPCTRAVRVGESERAGRWWWENDVKKECGLHLRPATPAPAEPLLRHDRKEIA